MSGFEFRPAKREGTFLLIGVGGPTGSGKTYSAMQLAKGLSNGKPFAVIDTEALRALHYAPVDPANPQPGEFNFEHLDFKPPFSPSRYTEAIVAAEKAGYGVIVVDSMSHEHAGDGGLLDMHEQKVNDMAKGDHSKRDKMNQAAWAYVKREHKKMVSRLLQLRCHLILCFRAEEKIEQFRNPQGRIEFRPKETLTSYQGWNFICEKQLPFELTMSLMMISDAPGVPKPIKLESQHSDFIDLSKPITPETGRLLGQWAKGEIKEHPLVDSVRSAASMEELQSLAEKCKTAPKHVQGQLRNVYKKRLHELEGEESQEPASKDYGEEPQE